MKRRPERRRRGAPVTLATLATRLQQTRQMSPQPELRFQPEPQARYALVDQTLAVIKRETKSTRQTVMLTLYLFGLAYLFAFAVYQITSRIL